MSLTHLASKWPVPWLLENGGVFLLAYLINVFFDVPTRGAFFWDWMRRFSQGLLSVDGVIFLQKFYAVVCMQILFFFSILTLR
jgi:hypothetical protein